VDGHGPRQRESPTTTTLTTLGPWWPVDSHDNESKGDRTPDEWLPPANHCRYIREFTSVKLRWELTVTRPEKLAIKTMATTGRNAWITYEPATINLGRSFG